MKIAFLENWFDGTNIAKMPRGIGFYITEALKKQGAEVEIIHPAVSGQFPYKVKQFFYKYFTNKKYFRHAEETLLRKEAKIRSEILKKSDADFIFSFGSLASVFLETDKKIAFWADSTMVGLVDYYPEFTNLPTNFLKKYIEIEKQGIEKASAVFYTSHWALDIAVQKMTNATNTNKIHFAPFGANLDFEKTQDEIEFSINQKIKNDTINLLFIGWHWERKGGNIAVEITKRLNELGRKAKLIVLGANPEINDANKNFVEIIGMVDKYKEQEKFCSFFYDSHFFVMPTLAECAAHTLVEANAFGLPSISHKTGGLRTLITDDVNGKLFEIGENIDNFCNYIIDNFENKERYKELCLSSFNEYKTRLNWDYGAKIVIDTMKKLYC